MKAGPLLDAFRRLPTAPLDEIVPGTAMLLAQHADDESLGCGGLIASLCDAGRPPLVVIVTDGTGSHPSSPSWPPERLRAQREREARDATARLGLPAGRLAFLRLRDTASPHDGPKFSRAVEALSRLATDGGCDTVLSTWSHDPHCDHESVWKMSQALCRRDGLRLLAYPVWGWLIPPETEVDAAPARGWRLEIGRHLDVKAQAIRAHESQYGALITDDPDGFRLPPSLLEVFAAPYEVFLLP